MLALYPVESTSEKIVDIVAASAEAALDRQPEGCGSREPRHVTRRPLITESFDDPALRRQAHFSRGVTSFCKKYPKTR